MKFLHLSDLHIGKKLGEYPLYEDQRFVLQQAIALAKEQSVDAIVIAGDIYDSSAPSAEAMDFYDETLVEFYVLGIPLILISGNHDSADRLHVASRILKENNVHVCTKIESFFEPIEVKGVRFYPLPYCRLADYKSYFEEDFKSVEDALAHAISKLSLDGSKPNVFIGHLAALPTSKALESEGSETGIEVGQDGLVGGSDTVSSSVLDVFDYAALGHIHKPQFVSEKARYSGALLQYHVGEMGSGRCFTVVEMEGKEIQVHQFPITLKRRVIVLKGKLETILATEGYEEDFVFAHVEADDALLSPMAKLKAKFPYCLGMDLRDDSSLRNIEAEVSEEELSNEELFAQFIQELTDQTLSEDEKEFVRELFERSDEE